MPLQLHEKQAVVEGMTDKLGRASVVVVAEYRGLSVAELTALRSRMRERHAEVQVIKNTLLRRACVAADVPPPEALLTGPTAVVLLYDDLSSPTKDLIAFAKDHEVFVIKGGVMDGKALDAAGVRALADLPSREALRASLLGVFQAPPRQLVTVLGAPLRDFVTVLHAYAEKAA